MPHGPRTFVERGELPQVESPVTVQPSGLRQARTCHNRGLLIMAGTGWPRGLPQADFGRQGHRAESQLPGAALYSRCRPVPVVGRRGTSDRKVHKAEVHRTSDPDWLLTVKFGRRMSADAGTCHSSPCAVTDRCTSSSGHSTAVGQTRSRTTPPPPRRAALRDPISDIRGPEIDAFKQPAAYAGPPHGAANNSGPR